MSDSTRLVIFASALSKAIDGFEKRIQEADFKMTVGDYLKLVQMEKENAQEEPKEIIVTWVEPAAKSYIET